MRRMIIATTLCLALFSTQAMAVTKSPTPTPKTTVKASATPTPKATATKKATPTKTPVKKNPIKPSPSPKWPPVGFKSMDDIYYRTPSVEVMMNVAAGNPALAKAAAACKEFSCGRLQVASVIGCLYWEIDSKVITPNPDVPGSFLTLGMLRTLAKRSAAQEVVTLVLPSGELYSANIAVVPTAIACHQDATTETVPSNTYLRR